MTSSNRFSPAEVDRIKQNADLAALIGSRVALKREGDEFKGLCPFHAENTPSFHVIPKKGFYYCFGCGARGDAISWLMQIDKLSFGDAARKLSGGTITARDYVPPRAMPAPNREEDAAAREQKIARARQIYEQTVPAAGTLVENYLASRGLSGAPVPAAIRFHPRLWCVEASLHFPAMAAGVRTAHGITGVHRTFLADNGGGKANVKKAKMMMGACRGGHVRLDPPAAVMAVAEGIETALTVRLARPGLAVWAALSLSNMDAPLPDGVREVILCADADNKDQRAADNMLDIAAWKHQKAGRRVRIARPAAGKDFNDMVRA